jgi:hypothetical protein
MKKRYLNLFLALIATMCAQADVYNQLTDLPTVYINTFNKAAITSKTTYIYAKMVYVDGDSVAQYDSLSIRGRGNSTWNLSKKPYRIKFLDKEKFLGKGYAKAKSWTLMANAADKSMIRNALTSEMGEYIGLTFNPAARFVDLVLNGKYLGTYQISDQIDVRPHRVDITEQPDTITEQSDYTGGYLLEVDGFMDGNYFLSYQSVPVRIHYPDEDDIVLRQNTYISSYIHKFEAMLYGTDFKDAEKGYRPYIDSLSLARWYIATEVSANPDGFYSIYFYKEKDDPHLYWGPLWDYDIAYNNCQRLGNITTSLMCENGFGVAKTWVAQMWKDPWFGTLVNREYKKMLDNGLQAHLIDKIDSMATRLQRSQALNYKTWSISQRMYYDELVLFSTYDEYIAYLKDFIPNRLTYLQSAFANKLMTPDPVPTPAFSLVDGYYYRITNAGTSNAVDVTGQSMAVGANICTWANLYDRTSQEWEIRRKGDFYQMINHLSGLALSDPYNAKGSSTNYAALCQTDSDATNKRQLWTIYPQGTAGYYNLINASTGRVANNLSGSAANGNLTVSYQSDVTRNTTSLNRLWYFTPTDVAIKNTTGIATEQAIEYALSYSRAGQRLRFIGPDLTKLTFKATVYTTSGQTVGSFSGTDTFSLANLSHGTYIVSWYFAGRQHSTKFSY